jgi:hypothetical protein
MVPLDQFGHPFFHGQGFDVVADDARTPLVLAARALKDGR